MIKENKTSLPISSNFLTQKLNNFSNSSDFKYKLLPVMEKKLTVAKGVMTMPQGFKSSGFGGIYNYNLQDLEEILVISKPQRLRSQRRQKEKQKKIYLIIMINKHNTSYLLP